MSRPSISLSSLRSALPCIPSSSSSVASSSSRPFSTSTPRPAIPKRKWAEIRAKRDALRPLQRSQQGLPDYVLGHINAVPDVKGRIVGKAILENPWEGCRLSKILLHPQTVWNSPMTNYAKGDRPKNLIPGISKSDEALLFETLPHVNTALRYNMNQTPEQRDAAIQEEMTQQEKQTEMMYRILDLRNADRATINAVNRKKVIEEFGQGNSGGSIVQAALLTLKIRGLNEHVLSMRKDIHNRHAMRHAIMQRARHLKFVRRRNPDKYDQLLVDIGLNPRTVEGELRTQL